MTHSLTQLSSAADLLEQSGYKAHAEAVRSHIKHVEQVLGLLVEGWEPDSCSEGNHPNDDNIGKPMCKTCEEWDSPHPPDCPTCGHELVWDAHERMYYCLRLGCAPFAGST
jgi:hypothetical protein